MLDCCVVVFVTFAFFAKISFFFSFLFFLFFLSITTLKKPAGHFVTSVTPQLVGSWGLAGLTWYTIPWVLYWLSSSSGTGLGTSVGMVSKRERERALGFWWRELRCFFGFSWLSCVRRYTLPRVSHMYTYEWRYGFFSINVVHNRLVRAWFVAKRGTFGVCWARVSGDMFSHEPSAGPVAWVHRLDGLFTYDYWKALYGFSNNA